jgi:alanine racemase
MPRSARATVDLRRLESNFDALRRFAPIPLMPVVKADAYGHGAPRVAQTLVASGAERVAVTFVEEAVHLRQCGIDREIVVLAGFETSQLEALWNWRLTPVISTARMAREIAAGAARLGPLDVHLKVDVGMTRLGFTPRDIVEAAVFLSSQTDVRIAGVMTHLTASDEDGPTTVIQLDVFDGVVADLARQGIRPQWVHAANSAALGDVRPTHTLARPGLLLYGQRPGPRAPAIDVRPVMSVSAGILRLFDIPAGVGVSYGSRFVTARPSRIASIPLGYADGVPRTQEMSREGWFLARGQRAPVAGVVCMDFTMVDVTDIPEAQEGDSVVLFGDGPTAHDLASWAGTTVWQVLTAVGSRLPRVYVRDGEVVGMQSRYGSEGPW